MSGMLVVAVLCCVSWWLIVCDSPAGAPIWTFHSRLGCSLARAQAGVGVGVGLGVAGLLQRLAKLSRCCQLFQKNYLTARCPHASPSPVPLSLSLSLSHTVSLSRDEGCWPIASRVGPCRCRFRFGAPVPERLAQWPWQNMLHLLAVLSSCPAPYVDGARIRPTMSMSMSRAHRTDARPNARLFVRCHQARISNMEKDPNPTFYLCTMPMGSWCPARISRPPLDSKDSHGCERPAENASIRPVQPMSVADCCHGAQLLNPTEKGQ
ncbi:hypothetical protein N431DRAFT_153316 [Stipitochalara longipes BDJ]|nr:hypothetical protein N431DRAFT_153316 [Stipitochalara longipes BDJ]